MQNIMKIIALWRRYLYCKHLMDVCTDGDSNLGFSVLEAETMTTTQCREKAFDFFFRKNAPKVKILNAKLFRIISMQLMISS
jgi:hypothetical protein